MDVSLTPQQSRYIQFEQAFRVLGGNPLWLELMQQINELRQSADSQLSAAQKPPIRNDDANYLCGRRDAFAELHDHLLTYLQSRLEGDRADVISEASPSTGQSSGGDAREEARLGADGNDGPDSESADIERRSDVRQLRGRDRIATCPIMPPL